MVLEWTLEFLINIWVTLDLPFTYMHAYSPKILTHWASFVPFAFGEWERSLGGRAQTPNFQLKWIWQTLKS